MGAVLQGARGTLLWIGCVPVAHACKGPPSGRYPPPALAEGLYAPVDCIDGDGAYIHPPETGLHAGR